MRLLVFVVALFSVSLRAQDSDLCSNAEAVLDLNWVGTSTIPAYGLYPHQWSWDTAFISYGHAVYNISRAMAELETLFEGQWTNGLVPHIVFNSAVPNDAYFPGADYWLSTVSSEGNAPPSLNTSGIINPPVHPSAVLNIMRRAPSSARNDTTAFLSRMLPKLTIWMNFLVNERDPDGNGLVYIRHPWESGMDNAPTWDSLLDSIDVAPGSIPPYTRTDIHAGVDPGDRPTNETYDKFVYLMICHRNNSYDETLISGQTGCPFIVEDVLFNTLLAQGCADMAELVALEAELTGTSGPNVQNEVQGWEQLANRTIAALDSLTWSEELGLHVDLDVRGQVPIPVPAVGGLAPLHLQNLQSSHRTQLLDTLLSDRFQTPFGVPSFDTTALNFSSHNYWRGPSWFNIDWLLLQGVRTNTSAATYLRNSLSQLILHGNSSEYWNPFNGTAHGSSSFSWTSALYLDEFCADADAHS